MKYSPYTASSLGTFNQCPRKFKYNKIDKIPVEFVMTPALIKGKIVHSFLEHDTLSLKDKIEKLKSEKLLDKELIKEGLSIYNTFRKTTFSETLFGYKHLGSELKISLKIKDKQIVPCDYTDKDAMYRGMIDSVFVDEDTDIVYIVDWKTGKDKSTGEYRQSPDQLMYYATWYFNTFPVDTIKILYAFVEHEDAYLEFTLTKDRLSYYNTMLLRNIKKVETETEFPKEESALCDFCDYFDYCIKDTKDT